MKKIASWLTGIFLLAACGAEPENVTQSGRSFVLNNPENGATVTLNFDANENRFYGKVVNNYFGSYEVNGLQIKFGNPASTMMMGPLPLMEAESNYLKTIEKVDSFALEGKILKLRTPDGTVLKFQEEVAPETTD